MLQLAEKRAVRQRCRRYATPASNGRALFLLHISVGQKDSMRPVAQHLSTLLGHECRFADDCVGDPAEKMAGALQEGDVLLLENLRFHPEEEKNDEAFARQLARLCDVYVNDAFGAAHRAHASTVGITKFVSRAAAGLLMEKELEYL